MLIVSQKKRQPLDRGGRCGEKMYSVDVIRQMQLEKVIGELNALKMSYFDPTGRTITLYNRAEAIIDNMIEELRNNLG